MVYPITKQILEELHHSELLLLSSLIKIEYFIVVKHNLTKVLLEYLQPWMY